MPSAPDALAIEETEAQLAWARAALREAVDRMGTSSRQSESARFGEYELLEELGHGATAVVHCAWQSRRNRLVALKIMKHARSASETERQRFRFGAEAAAQLDHPHIARVLDVGTHNGVPFCSMTLVERGTLAAAMPRIRQSPRADAVILMAKVADAVHHAHQHGVLHRDLKPANIVLDENDQPFVVDFGFAKHLDERALSSKPSLLVGTIGYVAPEQALEPSRSLTFASDIYGLGAILYELLTGEAPFEEATAAQHLERLASADPVPSPRSIDANVDRDLSLVCLKCLEKDPLRRYRSAADFAEDLGRWLRDEPISIVPESLRAGIWRWCRNRPARATALAGTLCVLAATAAVAVAVAKEQEQILLGDVLRSNLSAAQFKADHVLLQLQALSSVLARCAADPRIVDVLQQPEAPSPPPDRLLAQCGANSTFDSVALVQSDGTQRARLPRRSSEPGAFAGRDAFQGVRKLAEQQYRWIHVGRVLREDDGERYASLSAPVFGSDNRWLGAVCVTIKMQNLLEALRLRIDEPQLALIAGVREPEPGDPAQAREHGVMLLLDGERRDAPNSAPDPWLKQLTRLKEQGIGDDPFRVSEPNHSLADNPSPMSVFGKQWLAGFAPVGHTGYAVVVVTNYDSALARIKTALLRLVGWSGAILILGASFVLGAASTLRRQKRGQRS
jgi:serine/threonine-protein kinase